LALLLLLFLRCHPERSEGPRGCLALAFVLALAFAFALALALALAPALAFAFALAFELGVILSAAKDLTPFLPLQILCNSDGDVISY